MTALIEKYQRVCKPGSVHLSTRDWATIPLRRHSRAASSNQPGRRVETHPGTEIPCRPYSILLPVGFTLPLPLPVARCALAAPFHRDPPEEGPSALCGTVPGVAPAGRYPAPLFHGARTFLARQAARGRPTLWWASPYGGGGRHGSEFRDVGRRDAPPAGLARVRPRGATGRAAASHPPAVWGGGAPGGSCGIRRRPRRRPVRGGSGAGRPSSRPSCR